MNYMLQNDFVRIQIQFLFPKRLSKFSTPKMWFRQQLYNDVMLTISRNNQRVEKVEYKLLGIAIDEYFEPYRYVRKIRWLLHFEIIENRQGKIYSSHLSYRKETIAT